MAERRPGASVRARVRVLDVGADIDVIRRDDVATEEPLQIRLAAGEERRDVAVTMRTPGFDFELAAGWLAGEGVITSAEDLRRVDYCTDVDLAADQQYNVVTATLRAAVLPDLDRLDRHGYVTSACGVCGRADIESLAVRCAPIADDRTLAAAVLFGLPDRLRGDQSLFARTGGVHAAGLAGSDGKLLVVREDVGRHNAVDKVIGHRLLNGDAAATPAPAALVVSGRTSFEIVQKAVAAGIPVVAGVSAPSSLAVSLAEQFGITLVGFLRGRRANVYSHPQRIVDGVPEDTADRAPEDTADRAGEGAVVAAPAGA
ncbi:MAG: formate dehydrogenase accessory sulfurtransferase FdhD [bacterium]